MSEQRPLRIQRIERSPPYTPFTDDQLEQSIPERFERQASRHPDRLAIKSLERTFTYDGLNRTANRLARAIAAVRGGEAAVVALLLGHGANALAAMLAVLKAGKCYVVLDPAYPAERLAYMLDDSGADIVVTDANNRSLAGRLSSRQPTAVNIDELDAKLSDANLAAHPSPDALAMLVYTSGSTGRPKAAMHTHRTVQVEVRNLTNTWCVGSQDRWLLYTSLSFANSVRTIYLALLNGGSVYPYDLKALGFAALPEWLQSNRITVMRTVPTTFRNFMATLPRDCRFPDIRLLSIGGEPVYRSDVEAFNEHFAPGAMISHGLGPTECFMACLQLVPHGSRVDAGKLDIGWPLPDKEVLLLDEDGREVADGEVGEVFVRSRHIALGYWRDTDRTRGVFSVDPQDPSMRIYRTGDLGMRHEDGCLTHVGRRDFQVKIRGFRVDVSEVEVAMHAIDGVKDAVVVGREDVPGEVRLVAYFVASTTPSVTTTHIRRSLAKVLPEYMIPAAFVRLEAIPQTPNGKADRLRLPAPSRDRPELGNAFIAPATELERELAHIWSGVLAIDDIGIDDDFFELGGDSLAAARVVARVRDVLGVEVPLEAIFEGPTIAQLAKVIQASPPDTIDETPPPKRSAARR
jgi:amino acid adenylation domain-containing protein